MNQTKVIVPILSGLLSLSASGCLTEVAGDDAGDPSLDEAESALAGQNALVPNALVPNALVPNALVPNALVPNALVPNALSPNAMSAIQDPTPTGGLSRQLLRYTVGCAFEPSQSFNFSWSDKRGRVQTETYWGLMGLAPSWSTRALNVAEQEWVSACLASRVNWYGEPVTISSRGGRPELHKSSSSELATYAMNEGAFWGNVFSSTPRLFACHYGPNQDYSRSQMRDCAAGHLQNNGNVAECGAIDIVGSCEALCKPLNNLGQYYPECTGPDGVASTTVITTFLM
jgi:hypothetical protein